MFEASKFDLSVLIIKFPRKRKKSIRADNYFHRLTERNAWATLANPLSRRSMKTRFKRRFHTYWTVAGHKIRYQIGNDLLLADFLRTHLPKYTGTGLTLYRGENTERWKSGQIGLCWSTQIETARMFGRGLNATGTGGLLLRCLVSGEAIIAGPSEHSLHLNENEFTTDPRHLANIEIIEQYTCSD